MEVKRIRSLKVALIPKTINCDSLSRINADLFYTANTFNKPVLKEVVDEFEDGLKTELGVNGKIPKKTLEKELERGGIKFKVKSTPTSNPSYSVVGSTIEQYLTDIVGLNEDGMRREGVRTLEGEPYLLQRDVQCKLEEILDDNKNEGVRNTITYSKMKKEANVKKLINIEPGTYGKPTGENAKTCRIAKEQIKLIENKIIKPFKSALKKETGYSNDNIPEQTMVDMFEAGKYIFMVTSSEREEIKYGKIVQGFSDLVYEKQEFARQRDSNLYLPVNVLLNQYNELVDKHTRSIVQQDIYVIPQPRFDQVLVA